MRRSVLGWILGSILAGGSAQAAGQAVGGEADAAAVQTVETYLTALMAGDVARVGASLGDTLAAERGALLANPGYPESLQRAYADARYRITDSEQVAEGRARVDALLLLRDDQSVSVQFGLEAHDDNYKIVTEN